MTDPEGSPTAPIFSAEGGSNTEKERASRRQFNCPQEAPLFLSHWDGKSLGNPPLKAAGGESREQRPKGAPLPSDPESAGVRDQPSGEKIC